MTRGPKPIPVEERFNKYHTKGSPDECWIWTGAKLHGGYGVISANSKQLLAHRLALEIYLGRPISDGLNVLHSCDNPSCVNFNHLREGTQKDNMIDMASKLRVHNQKLTWDQIADIRSRVGQSQRAIAKEFGVSQRNIGSILNGRIWVD